MTDCDDRSGLVRWTGDRVVPTWLGLRDHGWLTALLDRVQSLVGRPRAEVESVLRRIELPEAPAEARRAVQALLLRLAGFELGVRLRPRQVRDVVFELAAAAPTGSRDQVLAAAGARLGAAPEEVLAALHADRPAERVLAAGRLLPAGELIERHHLELVRGLLRRATRVTVDVEGGATGLVRAARRLGLMVLARGVPGSAWSSLELSGPLSLLRRTTRYGWAMAAWLPALTRLPRWRLRATCRVAERVGSLEVTDRDPIGSTRPPGRRFDSAVEERLLRDLQRLGGGWRVVRESGAVMVGAEVAIPDFVLVHDDRRVTVGVEVVGFWTGRYLERKLDLLARLPAGQEWIACVDASLRADVEARAGAPPPIPGILWFRRRVDAGAVLELAAAAVKGRRTSAVTRLRAGPEGSPEGAPEGSPDGWPKDWREDALEG